MRVYTVADIVDIPQEKKDEISSLLRHSSSPFLFSPIEESTSDQISSQPRIVNGVATLSKRSNIISAKPDGEDELLFAIQLTGEEDGIPKILTDVNKIEIDFNDSDGYEGLDVSYVGTIEDNVHCFVIKSNKEYYLGVQIRINDTHTGFSYDIEFTNIDGGIGQTGYWSTEHPYKVVEGDVKLVPLSNGVKSDGKSEALILYDINLKHDIPEGVKLGYVVASATDQDLIGEYHTPMLARDFLDLMGVPQEDRPSEDEIDFSFDGMVNYGSRIMIGTSDKPGTDVLKFGVKNPITSSIEWTEGTIEISYSEDGDVVEDSLETAEICHPYAISTLQYTDGSEFDPNEITINYDEDIGIEGTLEFRNYRDFSKPGNIRNLRTIRYNDQSGSLVDFKLSKSETPNIFNVKIMPVGIGEDDFELINSSGLSVAEFIQWRINSVGDYTKMYQYKLSLTKASINTDNDVSVGDAAVAYVDVEFRNAKNPYIKADNVGVVSLFNDGDLYQFESDRSHLVSKGKLRFLVYYKEGIYKDNELNLGINVRPDSYGLDPWSSEETVRLRLLSASSDIHFAKPDLDSTEVNVIQRETEATGFHYNKIDVSLIADSGGPLKGYNDISIVTEDGGNGRDILFVGEVVDGVYSFHVASTIVGEQKFKLLIDGEQFGEDISLVFTEPTIKKPECEVKIVDVSRIDRKKSTIEVIGSRSSSKVYHKNFYYLLNVEYRPGFGGGGELPNNRPTSDPSNYDLNTTLHPQIDHEHSDVVGFKVKLFDKYTGKPLTGQNVRLIQKDSNLGVGGYNSISIEVFPGVYHISVAASSFMFIGNRIDLNPVSGFHEVSFCTDFDRGEDSVKVYFCYPEELTPYDDRYLDEYEIEEQLNPKIVLESSKVDSSYLQNIPPCADGWGGLILSIKLYNEENLTLTVMDGLTVECVSGNSDKFVSVLYSKSENDGIVYVLSGLEPGEYEYVIKHNGEVLDLELPDNGKFEVASTYKESGASEDALTELGYEMNDPWIYSGSRVEYEVLSDSEKVTDNSYVDVDVTIYSQFSFLKRKTDIIDSHYIDLVRVVDPMVEGEPFDYCEQPELLGEVEPGKYRFRFYRQYPNITPITFYTGPTDWNNRPQVARAYIVFEEDELSNEIDPDRSSIETDKVEIYADGEDTAIVSVTLYYKRNSEDEELRLATGIKNVRLHSLNGEIIGKQETLGEVGDGVYQFRIKSETIGKERLTFIATNPQ